MRSRRPWVVVAVVALLAAACSGSSSEGARPDVSTSVVPATPAPATATPPITEAPEGEPPTTCDPADVETCTWRELADARGILIGTAVGPSQLADDPLYRDTVAAEFNSLTPENAYKWPATEPEPGLYTWEDADAIADFAVDNGMRVRGHTLVWPNSMSAQQYSVLPEYVYATRDAPTLQRYIDDHIDAVVSRYGDVTDRWDVVNEPLLTLGDAVVDPNPLTEILGEEWIVRAFEQTRALDPGAQLYVNEVLTERPGAKHDALVSLVMRLLDAGAPIDGVGLQGHFLGGAPSRVELEQVMTEWEALGLEVAVTELDIPDQGDPEAQATQYADVFAACLAVDACVEITMWGFSDKHSWLNSFLGPDSRPLPFDEDYEPKPAYGAVAEVLAAS